MRTQPTLPQWRCVLALLTVMASLGLLAAGGAHATPSDDDATVTVTIPTYKGIIAEDVPNVSGWCKGINGYGELGPPGGNNPDYVGGSAGDKWPDPEGSGGTDGDVPYCMGAVARSTVTVYSNAPCSIQVQPQNIMLRLQGPQATLNAFATLAWPYNAPHLYQAAQRQWATPSFPGEDSSTWLYVCVERKGLQDRAGTYTGSVTIKIW